MCCDSDHVKIAREAIEKYKRLQYDILKLLDDFKKGTLE